MPLYDFRCDDCGTTFEKLVRNTAAATELDCPDCAGVRVRRELSLPAAPLTVGAMAAIACGAGPPCGAAWCQRKG